MKRFLLLSLLAFNTIVFTYAQEAGQRSDLATVDPQAMLADSISSIKASFGLTQIGGENYVGLRLQPEFRISKFGFGFDIPVQFNVDTREFRDEEFKGGVEVVRLIRYFSFGKKKADPIYVRAGDLSGVSLGYGTLINNYSNSPSFEFRKFGLNVDLNYKEMVGVEALYSDIKGVNVLGVRPYVRPLRKTFIPIVRSLELGASFVTDKGTNVDSTSFFLKQNGMSATAFDAGVTFLNTSFIKLVGYGQISKLKKIDSDTLSAFLAANSLTYEEGNGTSVGLSSNMRLAGAVMLDARIERLWYKDHYLPQFFDAIYEINKDAKILSLASAQSRNGIYGNLGIMLFSKFRINGAILLPDQISAESPALVQVGLEAAQLGDKLTISGNYIKGGLLNLDDAFTLDQNSLANFNVVYQLARFFYVGMDYRWTFAKLEDGSIKATDYVRPFFGLSFPLGGNRPSRETLEDVGR
ncbi:MAG TPA: hypothetical protein DIS90_05265 [Cytophagales bacterium]|nr:hypothetical protein [Cytophagales bacterium]